MTRYLWLLLFIPAFLYAQDNDRYLAGAVSEIDGKVTFIKEFQIPGLSQQEIFETALRWAQENFNSEKKRIVYTDESNGQLAILGEEHLVFTSTALSLDRSTMSYRISVECKNEICKITFSHIRYEYEVPHKREPERYSAENWITDKHALTKGKLNRVNGKFRTGTIDFADQLFSGFSSFVGLQMANITTTSSTQKENISATIPSSVNTIEKEKKEIAPIISVEKTLDGYKQVKPDKIPGNIIKMLSEDWMLITAGNNAEFNMMTASWGGLGNVLGKPVAFCFIVPTRYTYQLMEKNDTYTLTFYTEAYREALLYCGNHSGREIDKVKETGLTPITTPSGSKAFGEAWLIIECKKLLSQPLNSEFIHNEQLKEEWLGKQLHKMYIGEIINVWIK